MQPLHFISTCLPHSKQIPHDHTPCLHKFMNHSVHMVYEYPKLIILSFLKVSRAAETLADPCSASPPGPPALFCRSAVSSSPSCCTGLLCPRCTSFAEAGKADQTMPQVVGLNGSPALQHMNRFYLSQFGVRDKLADSTLWPVMEAVNKVLDCVNPITNTWTTPLAAICPATLEPLATTSCPTVQPILHLPATMSPA